MAETAWISLETAAALGRHLVRRGWMLGTAESCTGGGVAAALTALPGSSAWFAGGVVCYSNAWKQRCLGVRTATLRRHGAVSAETVAEMLEGLCRRQRVEAGLAVSGIAGPGGGTPDKPVGTVYIGAQAGSRRRICLGHFAGEREAVRHQAATVAADLLLALLNDEEPRLPDAVAMVAGTDTHGMA